MRKLILGFYVSLDGKSADADNGIRDVLMSIDDPEQEKYFVDRLWEAGAFLMGRKSYEVMADFWPTSDHPLNLHLIKSTAFPSGILELIYAPRPANESPSTTA